MQIHRYTVIFEPAEEGGYVVHVPALNGAATQGETLRKRGRWPKTSLSATSKPLPRRHTRARRKP